MHRILFIFLIILSGVSINAQVAPDGDYMSNVQSIQFIQTGKPLSYPIVELGKAHSLRLDFDDLDGKIKNYYYTYIHCNADWQPSLLMPVNYIKGFVLKKIINYTPSTISKQQYIHYTVQLPEAETMPTQSGNYILKVFLDGDTSKVAFTRRMMIVENIASIQALVQQPFDANKLYTHQKLQFVVNTSVINLNNPQQLKVNVLQNYNWNTAAMNLQPDFIRPQSYEYNNENKLIFEAGKEYRWIDMSNLRMKSDKIQSIDDKENIFKVTLFPEVDRVAKPFLRYDDFNGAWIVRTNDAIKSNPNINGDYALVHFVFAPSNLKELEGKDVYWVGRKNNFALNETSKMKYNDVIKCYEIDLLLKEGYYTYNYVSKDEKDNAIATYFLTEGNDWQTENKYTVLVYYRSQSDFADRLIGIKEINSVQEAN